MPTARPHPSPRSSRKGWLAAAALLLLAAPAAQAQHKTGPVPGIYACTDTYGRRITSDRPIPECLNREQRELNANGVVRRTIQPAPTAAEESARAERARREAEARSREEEQARRDRMLLARYPQPAAHEAERAVALQRADETLGLVRLRIQQLQEQRAEIDAAIARHQAAPEKMPAGLKGERAQVQKALAAQQATLAEQQEERRRTERRFDAEQARLRPLWSAAAEAPRPAGDGAR